MPDANRAPDLEGRPASTDDLTALSSADPAGIQALEACIKVHHVAENDYVEATGETDRLTVRPAFFRFNKSDHLVLWWMPVGEDHWHELLVDGIRAVRDTGEVFTPGW